MFSMTSVGQHSIVELLNGSSPVAVLVSAFDTYTGTIWYPARNVHGSIFRLHRMHEILTIVTNVCCVCQSVCLSRGLNRRRRMHCTPRAVCAGSYSAAFVTLPLVCD